MKLLWCAVLWPVQAASAAELRTFTHWYNWAEGYARDGWQSGPMVLSETRVGVGVSEWRPKVDYQIAKSLGVVLEPRARIRYARVVDRSGEKPSSIAQASETFSTGIWFRQLYTRIRGKDGLSFTVGVKEVDWGPGELTCPTNLLFPKTLQAQTPYYENAGALMGLFEFVPTGTFGIAVFVAPKDGARGMEDSALVKMELSSEALEHRLGVVAGGRKEGDLLAGGYAEFFSGSIFSPYVDGAVKWVRRHPGRRARLQALAGLKVDGGELGMVRFEALRDETASVLGMTESPKTDLSEESLLHLSYVLPDTLSKWGVNLFAHLIFSADKNAGMVKSDVEFLTTSQLDLLAGLGYSFGSSESALTRWFRAGGWLGARMSW